MSSGGSALQMVQTIKFNKSLLSNRKSFGELKAYLNRRIEKRAGLKVPDIDSVVLAQIIKEIRIERQTTKRRNFIVVWSLIITGLFALVFLVFYMYSTPYIETNPEKLAEIEYRKYKEEKALLDAQQKFNYYISDGYEWLNKNKFHNAIYQFDLAVKTKPTHYGAHLGLAKTLLKQCAVEHLNCDRANSQLNIMFKKFSSHEETKQALSNYLLILGDTNLAVKVLTME